MLVRGGSATPEGSPAATTPTTSRKRKQAAADIDESAPADTSGIVLARDTSRPRLTVSRHPVFLPPTDGSPFLMTEFCAVNRILDKVGFKYSPAGLADPGAAIPYRTIESRPMMTRVSWEDRSPFVRVTQDGLGLAGSKGFRSARTNVGIQEGKWYMEVKVEKGGGDGGDQIGRIDGAHVRLGWGRREAPLNGPVGLDGYSYGIRDRTGDKVTLSRPKPYAKPFGTGDVIGLYIYLPPRPNPNPKDPDDPAHVHRERIAIDFKGQEYFESLDYPQSKEMLALMDYPSKTAKADLPPAKKSAMVKNLPSDRGRNKPMLSKVVQHRPLPVLHGSKTAFFINGECQGVAFQDLYDYLQLRPRTGSRKGKDKHRRNRDGPREHTENHFDDGTLGYYPFFSLFGDAQIRLNPGPDFAFPPPPDIDALLDGQAPSSDRVTWRPMAERYGEFMSQQWELDAKEEAEAKGKSETEKVLDEAEEEKLRLRRERKRKSEAARRRRLKEEKNAAAAAAAASDLTVLPDMNYVPSSAPAASPVSQLVAASPAPSLAPSIAMSSVADVDMEDLLYASALRTPTCSPFKGANDSASVDVGVTQMPQVSHSTDIGNVAQQKTWNTDTRESANHEPQQEIKAEQQNLSGLLHAPVPLGFEESSTRWTDT